MDGGAMVGVVLMVVILLVIVGVMVPLLIRSASKRGSLAKTMQQGPQAKTGLQGGPSRFEGNFQGFPAYLQVHLDFNIAGMVWNQQFGGARSFFNRYEFGMRIPGGQFAPTTFYEKAWLGRLGDVEWQRRAPVGHKQPTGVPHIDSGIDVYTMDPQFAAYLAGSPELGQYLARWPFLNLQINGDTISLELMETWNALESKFGQQAMYGWDFALQGLQMMAALARTAVAARPPMPMQQPYGAPPRY